MTATTEMTATAESIATAEDLRPPVFDAEGNEIDPATGEILLRDGVHRRFEVTDLASAAWLLRKRARDEKRLDDLRAAMQAEIAEETERIKAAYAGQLERAERNVGWWSQFDDQLEFLAHAETMEGKDRSVAIGTYRIGFRINPGRLATREGVVTKSADPKKDLPIFAFCMAHAPSAMKVERSFLISELKKIKGLDPVKLAPELFEETKAEQLFYVEVNGVKHERKATIPANQRDESPAQPEPAQAQEGE